MPGAGAGAGAGAGVREARRAARIFQRRRTPAASGNRNGVSRGRHAGAVAPPGRLTTYIWKVN